MACVRTRALALEYKTMFRIGTVLVFTLFLSAALAQQSSTRPKLPPPNQAPPRSDQNTVPADKSHPSIPSEESSSKENPPDLTPPPDDAKTHPDSGAALHEAEDAAGLHEGDEIGGVQEFKPWNPHKAEKDVEVGDFYFKRKNYRAALDRYREALIYKNDDAVATFRLAVCQEKLGDNDEARKAYEAYLKILPHGPFAGEAQQAIGRLKAHDSQTPSKDPTQQ
jgi:tetratricopeptide (TPR) repeat protein